MPKIVRPENSAVICAQFKRRERPSLFAIDHQISFLVRREAAILAPLAERHNDYVEFLAALGEEITMARGIVFVGLDPKYPMLHQLFQSRREDVPGQAQRPVKFPEMLEPDERIADRSEHTSELQSLMRNSYAVFCFKPKL